MQNAVKYFTNWGNVPAAKTLRESAKKGEFVPPNNS